jgi:hypothetical protein
VFWGAYPKKVDKLAAVRAWRAVLRKNINTADVVHAATRYAAQVRRDGTEKQFVKNPATWLNAGSYEDYSPPPNPFAGMTLEQKMAQIRKHWAYVYATDEQVLGALPVSDPDSPLYREDRDHVHPLSVAR